MYSDDALALDLEEIMTYNPDRTEGTFTLPQSKCSRDPCQQCLPPSPPANSAVRSHCHGYLAVLIPLVAMLMTRSSSIATTIFFLFLSAPHAHALTSQTCDLSDRMHVLEPDAQAFIHGILVQHYSSEDGSYGCDQPLVDVFQATEALRFAVERLNQDAGQIGGIDITDSYIPGVKIGN